VRVRVRTRREQRQQGDGNEVAECRLRPTNLGGTVEPGGIDEEDDACDQDFAEPACNEEHRRENDAPETQFRKAHRGCEVEHVPGDPEEKGTDQQHCEECQERNEEPAGDERAESEDSEYDAEDGTHSRSLCRRCYWEGCMLMDARIRPAAAGEGERLREIAIAAKGYWGYDLDRVREWAAIGDFSTVGLRRKGAYVAAIDGNAVGWAAAVRQGDVWWLDDLWIEPAWMGRGIGSRLFKHAAARGRRLGAVRMEWEAEPNALGFYEKMGGRYARDGEPGIWGRVNAVMELDLS
jgi:GNAT superfamily N-acetyltransferase